MLHKYDSRDKIVVAVTFSVIVALADRPMVLFLGIVFSVCLILAAQPECRKLFVRLFIVNGFIAFLWLFLPFTHDGEPIFSIGPLQATLEGIKEAFEITIKSNVIILATIALLGTSNISSLVHALWHLKCPDKLVHLFFFCFRYIHVLQQEYTRLSNAIKIRNFKPKTNLHTYRTFAYVVGMLLVNSFDRSHRIYQAMLCRGFHGKYYVLGHFKRNMADTVVSIVMMLCIAVMVVMQWVIII